MKKFKIYHTEGSLGNMGGMRKSNEALAPTIIEADDADKAKVIFSDLERAKVYAWRITRIEDCPEQRAA